MGQAMTKSEIAKLKELAKSLQDDAILSLIERLERYEAALELAMKALEEHHEYAQKCRSDWSEYDGRTHLSRTEYINYKTTEELARVLEGKIK